MQFLIFLQLNGSHLFQTSNEVANPGDVVTLADSGDFLN